MSIHGKWTAFMIWGDCLFMMSLDGNVKECSRLVTWGYFDIVLDNELEQREWHPCHAANIFLFILRAVILYYRGRS